MAYDRFGRHIHYLRISLTDHCNLRCIYCMPEEMTFRPNNDLMQDNEILYFVSLFTQLGFTKFRLTGGEPTVRQGIVDLVRNISTTPGVQSLSMTSNGILMANIAYSLKEAGLQRVNFSLDTTDSEKYYQLTRRQALDSVWAGIRAAEEAGLSPIKINVVIARDYNELDIPDLARLAYDNPWQVRFIEMMPFAGTKEFQLANVVTAKEIQDKIENRFGNLEIINGGKLDGEARLFRINGGRGSIGFISTITQPFCADCTRARLTSDGRLRLCLLRDYEVDLLGALRAGASHQEMRATILEAIWNKPWGNRLAEGEVPMGRVMSQIGG